MENRFPKLWVPSAEQRDVRQLLIHRHKLVEIRTRVKNGLQHLAMNRGMQKKGKLWSVAGQKALRELPLQGWAAEAPADLLGLLKSLDEQVGQLDRAVEEEAQRDKMAQLLRTQPGVGPITALAFVVTIGDVSRFRRGKQVASYLGLIPRERSSGGRQRLGAISKQGNRFLRTLLVEAAHGANQRDEGFRKTYQQRCHRMAKGVAKVAAARKLAVRLYWMLRTNTAVSGDRFDREQPAGAPGQRKLDRRIDWRSRLPTRREVRIEESWPISRPYRWLVKRELVSPQSD